MTEAKHGLTLGAKIDLTVNDSTFYQNLNEFVKFENPTTIAKLSLMYNPGVKPLLTINVADSVYASRVRGVNLKAEINGKIYSDKTTQLGQVGFVLDQTYQELKQKQIKITIEDEAFPTQSFSYTLTSAQMQI